MKKFLLFISIIINLYSWELKGTAANLDINSLNLNGNIIWAYQNGEWKTNYPTDNHPTLQTINGGEGFWIYNDITLNDSVKIDNYKWRIGWNLVTPVFENWNLDDKFKNTAPVIWKYDNNKWYLYSKIYTYENTFDTLNIGEGAWVYVPEINIKMNNTPLFCENGKCSKLYTTNTSYNIYLKTNTYNTDLKFAFDLYRYSNNTHYKLAIGPFQINANGITTKEIAVCVEKEGVGGSCKKVDNTTNTFLTYKYGYLGIDSQKIATLFDKSIPNTKEKFSMKIYISGFDINGFKNDNNFGTLGIEGFGTWVSVTNNKSIKFEMEIK